MTPLEQEYGLTSPKEVDFWDGIVQALRKAMLMLLFIVPDFTVSDFLNAMTESNYSNNAMVTEW